MNATNFSQIKDELNNQELFTTQGISLQELEERKEMLVIVEGLFSGGPVTWFPECNN
ncbi:MAG: hypothetical protein LBE13_11090 [Bacteroidales bacterium]|jgi:hypothetical protein|nr:hypothetical protein [Bacteroidales bacterium]